jgi:UDP-N-acetylmuramoyl-tripeptide--D-alanyl-D-alanine ligase
MMNLQQAADWLPGARLVGSASTMLSRVHTDTRTLRPGEIFLWRSGEKI